MNTLLNIIKSKYFKIFTLTISIAFFISAFFIKIDSSIFNTWGYFGIFIFNIFSSGILLIPLLIDQVNPIVLVTISALGMSLNESLNWYIGYVSNEFIKESTFEKKIEKILEKYQYYAIFILALIPFPFDMIGTFSGRLNIPYLKYLITIFSARIVRFTLIIYALNYIR